MGLVPENSRVLKLVICLKYIYIYCEQKKLGQVVNYVTIYNGHRLKSSHTQRPSYSIYRAPFAPFITPFDSVHADSIQDVRCVYTSYDITIRSDRRLAYCWDSIVRQKLIRSIPKREFLRIEHHYTWFTLYMSAILLRYVIWLDKALRRNIPLAGIWKERKKKIKPDQCDSCCVKAELLDEEFSHSNINLSRNMF